MMGCPQHREVSNGATTTCIIYAAGSYYILLAVRVGAFDPQAYETTIDITVASLPSSRICVITSALIVTSVLDTMLGRRQTNNCEIASATNGRLHLW
jgi:hypothetical protein